MKKSNPIPKALAFLAVMLSCVCLTRAQFAQNQFSNIIPPNPDPWVSLGWDYPTSTAPGSISYFKVYWGPSHVFYTNNAVSSNLTVSITNFNRGVAYFFGATSVSTNGLESTNFSNEVIWQADLPPVNPLNLRITGGK
jgi:hypothetical protein